MKTQKPNKFIKFKMIQRQQPMSGNYFHTWCPLQIIFCLQGLNDSVVSRCDGWTDGRTDGHHVLISAVNEQQIYILHG